MHDQAESLRRKMSTLTLKTEKKPIVRKENRPTQVITITSGKGGVGKSNFALNFALSLLEHNKKVLLFDVDVGFANIDLLMGFSPKQTLIHLMEERLSIWEVIEKGPHGLEMIAGGSGFNRVFQLDEEQMAHFLEQLSELQGYTDYIILDTGAGLSPDSLRYIMAADEVILITTPEPTSYMDAYAVLKSVHHYDPGLTFKLIINRCMSVKEGKQTFHTLHSVANQFLKKEIYSLGFIPEDAKVNRAVKAQIPFVLEYPESKAAKAIREITATFLNLPLKRVGGVRGFLNKMFHKLG